MGAQPIRLLVLPLCILHHEFIFEIYMFIMYNMWRNKTITYLLIYLLTHLLTYSLTYFLI